jgi:hypothetical protein
MSKVSEIKSKMLEQLIETLASMEDPLFPKEKQDEMMGMEPKMAMGEEKSEKMFKFDDEMDDDEMGEMDDEDEKKKKKMAMMAIISKPKV